MIADGGDKGNIGGGHHEGGRENMGAEAFQPRVEKTDSTRQPDATDARPMTVEQGVEAAAGITSNLQTATADKMTRFSSDPAAKQEAVDSCRDAIAFHQERNQAAGYGVAAGTMISDAFEAGLKKTT